MRCQACDKNEATTTVICGSCQAHYASIREGQYREQELSVGDFQLRITSWTAVASTAAKKEVREEKAAKKKGGGFFGRKAAPEPEP
ncbi:MAG: hypothetical protein JWM80_566, partial [Cyanobacteria bacterium RYN_339]|nr:hypothetical protein [Cyanobacteria bacterium RYN_339]